MVLLEVHSAGVLVSVRAAPGASRSGLRGVQAGALKLAVTQIAEKGKANSALAAALAEALGLKRSQVELYSGETQKHKKFLVRNVSREELAAAIAHALGRLAE